MTRGGDRAGGEHTAGERAGDGRAGDSRPDSLLEHGGAVVWELEAGECLAALADVAEGADDPARRVRESPAARERLREGLVLRDATGAALSHFGADSTADLAANLDAVLGADPALVGTLCEHLRAGRERFRTEAVVRTLDGERRHELVEGRVRFPAATGSGDGDARTGAADCRVYLRFTDITERKRTEDRLETLHDVATDLLAADSRDEVYDGLVEAAIDTLEVNACVVFAADGGGDGDALRVVRLGGDPAELPDTAPEDVIAAATRERGETLALTAGEASAEFGVELAADALVSAPLGDHGVFQVGVDGAPAGGPPSRAEDLVGVLAAHGGQALANLERARELRRSEERLDALSRAFPDFAFLYDEEGRYVDVLLGWESDVGRLNLRDDLVGETVDDVLSPAAAGRVRDAIEAAMATGEVQATEYEVDTPNGTLRYGARAAPLPDEAAGEGSVILAARDITERHETEQDLRESNARLAELASVLSHDLRNLVMAVDSHLSLAQRREDLEPVGRARETLDRIEELLSESVTLARQEGSGADTGPVDLPAAATAAWEPFETDGATLTVEADRTLRADETRLRRLFENLYANAIEHSEGDVTVRVGATADGFYVADDGPGVPPDERETVFDPGYTTSESGSGLGLLIVEQVADAHGWDVSLAESAAGGARFEFSGVESADGAGDAGDPGAGDAGRSDDRPEDA